MGIPDHLTCLLRNLYAGQEATVRTRHGKMDWFKIGKGVHQGCILSLCLFNLHAKYIMQNAMILVFWTLSFKPVFSLSSAIRVVLAAYLRLLIFLLEILIPAYASSPAFHMMYFAYKLNKQGDNIQPWCTPFPIWNQFFVPCLVLTVASWPACRFFRRQVRWSGVPLSLRIFTVWFDPHSQGFSIVN